MITYANILDYYCADFRKNPEKNWAEIQKMHTYRELSMAAIDMVDCAPPPHNPLGLAYYAGGTAYKICQKRGIPVSDDLRQDIVLAILDRISKADYNLTPGETWTYTISCGIRDASCPYIRMADDDAIRATLYPLDCIAPNNYITPDTSDDLANEIIRLAIDQPDKIRKYVHEDNNRPGNGRRVLTAIIRHLTTDLGLSKSQVYAATNHARLVIFAE